MIFKLLKSIGKLFFRSASSEKPLNNMSNLTVPTWLRQEPKSEKEMLSAIYCNHANECPHMCDCPDNCYCKFHACKNRR